MHFFVSNIVIILLSWLEFIFSMESHTFFLIEKNYSMKESVLMNSKLFKFYFMSTNVTFARNWGRIYHSIRTASNIFRECLLKKIIEKINENIFYFYCFFKSNLVEAKTQLQPKIQKMLIRPVNPFIQSGLRQEMCSRVLH